MNTDLPPGLREEFDHARVSRKRIKLNRAVEQAILNWIADPQGVAPVLSDAYYNGDRALREQLGHIIEGWRPKFEKRRNERAESDQKAPRRSATG